MRLGLDVGSTTMKCVLLDEQGNLLFSHYQRHYSQIPETALSLLEKMKPLLRDRKCSISISGSAGMGMAQNLHLPFVQEVYATRTAVLKYLPGSNVVIELGGEDAKILFLDGNLEVRMNGTCAGGTGSFIDQMASLLGLKSDQLDDLAKEARSISSQVPEEGDPVEALADGWCGLRADTELYDPKKEHIDALVQKAQDSGADAVIILLAKFCDPEEFEAPLATRAIREAGLKCITVEIDQSTESYEQARTQVQTLAELIG